MAKRTARADRLRRDAAIIADRARGAKQEEVASRYGVSVRQVRNICSQTSGSVVAAALSRGEELVLGVITEYEDLRAELQALPKAQPSVQLGAIKARMQLLRDRTQLLQSTGLIPADMYAVDPWQDAMFVVDTLLETLDEFDVPIEVQRTIVERVEAVGRPRGFGQKPETLLPVQGGDYG